MRNKWIKTVVLALVVCAAVGLCAGRAVLAQGAGSAAGTGNKNTREVQATPEPTPEPTPVPMVELPNGRETPLDTKTLDLRALRRGELKDWLPILERLKDLEEIALGEERENGPTWEEIAVLRQAAPQARIAYRFDLYGVSVELEDESIDINHIEVGDRGEYVRQVIACMPRLRYLCMDSCGVSDEDMAALRDDFPEVDVVWRIWFGGGKVYSVRTDVEKILASKTTWAGEMTNEYVAPIKYCTKLKYLDIGHNEYITDISFVRNMPDLEVFIVALNGELRDISPLADCPKLEYLEIFNTAVSDLSPLAGLDKLRHLNISYCWLIEDISPIYGLELDRLYLGFWTPVPQEQVDEYRRLHPNCDVNNTLADGSQGTWRYTDDYGTEFAPRYALLREQFGYDTMDYSVFWLDPNY